MTPLVSVIITSYNRKHLLPYSVHSVINQTYKNIQIIIIDDCSDFDIFSLVNKTVDNSYKIEILRNNKNKGLSFSRNKGITLSKGKYIAFLDDDDIWFPNRLALQVSQAENSSDDVAAFYCGKTVYDIKGDKIDIIPKYKGSLEKAILQNISPPPATLFLKKSALEDIKGFDESLISCIDHDIWFSLAYHGFSIDYLPYSLVFSDPHSHDDIKMTINYKNRLLGINQFLNKWKKYILDIGGSRFYNAFSNHYYSNSYLLFAVNTKSKYSYFLRIYFLLKSLKYNFCNFNSLVFLFFSFLFGKHSLNILTRIKKSI